MKKRERNFRSLEDVEQGLRHGLRGGRKQEQKSGRGKTGFWAELPEPAELVAEYGGFLLIPLICVLLMLVILIAEPLANGGAQTETAETAEVVSATADGTEAADPLSEGGTEETPEGTADADGLSACSVPEIETLINEYFAARLSADTQTLYRLFGRTTETGMDTMTARLKAQASWIQSYDGITVYTMPGMDESARVCIVRYKINFRRTDTDAPGIMYCYVTRQDDGSWQIGENLTSEKVQYINEKLQDPKVLSMQQDVDAQLRSALSADSTLALIYTSFLNGEIYNETAPDLNEEQEVDLFPDPEDSDLAGGLIIDSETDATEAATQEAAEDGTGAETEPALAAEAQSMDSGDAQESDTETEETAPQAESGAETE